MKKKLLSILLCLCMVTALLPTAALAADATATADFAADSTAALALLNANKTAGAVDSTWTGSEGAYILTLNGVNFITSAATAIKLPVGTTIVLADGTINTVTSSYSNTTGTSYGIYIKDQTLDGKLAITGAGTLTVTGGTAGNSYGIWCYDSIAISGSTTVTAIGGTAKTAESGNSYGISSYGGCTFSGSATVIATGGTAARSYGIYNSDGNSISISDSATFEATGGTNDADYGQSYGFYTSKLSISGNATTVTATGGKVTGDHASSCGINGRSSIKISENATVTAMGNTAKTSYGIECFSPDTSFTISGGTVTAKTTSNSDTKAAFSKAPTLDSYTNYQWRTDATQSTYTQSTTAFDNTGDPAYVQIKSAVADPTGGAVRCSDRRLRMAASV